MKPVSEDHFTFIDLFAGIGGIRLGFEAHDGHCVFTSEWNSFAQKTYLANFPQDDSHLFAGDITAVDAADVPDHDVLLAGFPCQPFSIAGVSKKNALDAPMASNALRRVHCFSMWPLLLPLSSRRHFYWRMLRTCCHMTRGIPEIWKGYRRSHDCGGFTYYVSAHYDIGFK